MSNLELWHSVEKTDPAHTKGFKRGGGFEGTAVSPMYLIRRATELWGPIGGRWGVDVVEEKLLEGAPIVNSREEVIGHEKVHEVRILLRHPNGSVPAVGQTTFVGKNKYGAFTDEEAPKKSLTDALSKALSWLGFAADIHMGRYDDNKYVNELKREFAEAQQEKPAQITRKAIPALASAAADSPVPEDEKPYLDELAGELEVVFKAKGQEAAYERMAIEGLNTEQLLYLSTKLASNVRNGIKAVSMERRKQKAEA